MRKEERSVFVGRLSAVEGIVTMAKYFYVDVEWICRDVRDNVGVVAISGRVPEMLRLKSALPPLKKEGAVYSV